ncbi:MAG: antirestriction protein [Desulfobacteraceae bacterium]|nr:MAG: antirestriction protein [Desulfobacteraceae bacterium]
MKPKVKEALNKILERFESGDIPEAVAYSMFPIPNLPCSNWSLINRTLVFLSGSMDARGIRQWNSVNRFVKQGMKAIYILVPFIRNVEDDLGENQHRLLGFGVAPVFTVESTEGEPLTEYENIQVPADLSLLDRAHEWGISIKAVPGNYQFYGFYAPGRKEIAIATSQEVVFFHELAHAGHHILLKGNIRNGQDPLQEVVAELSASVLSLIVGKSIEDTTGNSYRYIQKYAEQLNMSVHTACVKVLADTEKVLNLIIHNNINGEESPYQKVA